MNFQDLVTQCDELVRSGKISAAAKLIGEVNVAKIPRQWRQPIANICRRTGLVTTGLRVLSPIIHSEAKGEEAPSELEFAEYSVLLQRSGAPREALDLLANLNVTANPAVHLYRSFCHFNLREPGAAAIELRAYLNHPLPSYSMLLGQVNLASALTDDAKLDEALAILPKAVELATESGSKRLLANCLRIWAQTDIERERFAEAKERLDRASEILGSTGVHDEVLVRESLAIVEALKIRSTKPLIEFRTLARKRGELESLREVDLYALKIAFDERAFEYLYYGTPFASFRKRIERLLKRVPRTDVYQLGGSTEHCLDLQSGRISKSLVLPPGGKLHGFASVLLLDFYRPVTVSAIASAVFPGERFNIFSTPHRVRQVAYRFREWLRENDVPIEIGCNSRGYRLRVAKGFSIRLRKERGVTTSAESLLEKLLAAFADGETFNLREACESLGVTAAVLRPVLRNALESGRLDRHGAGPATRYFIDRK
jgi:tetratricopeptide (TPR) repeat protein